MNPVFHCRVLTVILNIDNELDLVQLYKRWRGNVVKNLDQAPIWVFHWQPLWLSAPCTHRRPTALWSVPKIHDLLTETERIDIHYLWLSMIDNDRYRNQKRFITTALEAKYLSSFGSTKKKTATKCYACDFLQRIGFVLSFSKWWSQN